MKIAIIGNNGRLENTYKRDIDDLFLSCGYNTGNLVYWYAVDSHICDEKEYFGWEPDLDYINKNFDFLIFVASNQLNPAWDMGILGNVFDKLKIPFGLIGLGSQIDSGEYTFKQGTLKFIQTLKNAAFVSVRGEFTADVLDKYGVNDNVYITGCPSNFINFEKNFIKGLDYKEINKIVVNMNINGKFSSVLKNLYKQKDEYIFKYIIQDDKNIVNLCREKSIDKGVIRHLAYLFGANKKEFYNYFISNIEVFFNVECWMEFLRKFHFSFGSRMHGNMLAFQSGVMSLFITHDNRLSELVKTMKVPHVSLEEFNNYKNITEFLKSFNFDLNEYYTRRKELLKVYLSMFDKYNIKYNGKLNNIL
jgi:hypothetical protein